MNDWADVVRLVGRNPSARSHSLRIHFRNADPRKKKTRQETLEIDPIGGSEPTEEDRQIICQTVASVTASPLQQSRGFSLRVGRIDSIRSRNVNRIPRRGNVDRDVRDCPAREVRQSAKNRSNYEKRKVRKPTGPAAGRGERRSDGVRKSKFTWREQTLDAQTRQAPRSHVQSKSD